MSHVSATDGRLLVESGLFQPEWYLHMYPDVRRAAVVPLQHFLAHGAGEGRDPGPNFCTDAYLRRYPDVDLTGMMPVVHYLKVGRRLGRTAEPMRLPGYASIKGRSPTILVCGHSASAELFGGERSFLDLVQGLAALGFNLVVTVPEVGNRDYIEQLRRCSLEVVQLRCPWWTADLSPSELVVKRIQDLIREYAVAAVHVNTIMLREPLVAARRLRVAAVVHAREIPPHDPTLCEIIGASADQVVSEVAALSDHVVANSRTTANCYAAASSVHIVPNLVRVEEFSIPADAANDVIRVAMISSNLPKKGVHDVVDVAAQLERELPQVRFALIGPENTHIAALKDGQLRGTVPANVEFPGYALSPAQAMAQADIVLCLSRFQESFGRTVLEAMAAGRPVIAYRWGAVPELVRDGQTGYLVPLGDTRAVAECVRRLCAEPAVMRAMGVAGRSLAQAEFGFARYTAALDAAYRKIIG